jgi:hypothetical protein
MTRRRSRNCARARSSSGSRSGCTLTRFGWARAWRPCARAL